MAGVVVNRALRAKPTALPDLQAVAASSPSSCNFRSMRSSFPHRSSSGLFSRNRADKAGSGARRENFNKQGSTAVFVPAHDNRWRRPWVEELRTFFKPWRNCWVQALEILIEKGIIGSQSFALIAVAGSLVGSILCFVEGCSLVLKSSAEYFRFASARIDQALIVKLLVEAIGMFLIGSALLTFGMALYVMFVGTSESQRSGSHTYNPNFGLFNLKKLKQGVKKQSVAQVKSKVGHAVLLLLQAGVMEKFTDVPLANCGDLACFAGAVLASSASVFLLSRLMIPQNQNSIN